MDIEIKDAIEEMKKYGFAKTAADKIYPVLDFAALG